ncbi:chemoreceptor glutamine deamidase CheD [Halovulum dunhuangense]|uniref:Probable chemoreceptor glutamine deamidase CheD n=1 Tax=Halovulum dunhuangense TaxID=1505036 RepID=A0A849KQP8_9RHOB|nr:chemoreceptor glutamine deamidase CheD [Halovulum dunhuangense]NNU79189.1 chemoreceptor glutamine deamidase CheD [Halovulum dunhuangense]
MMQAIGTGGQPGHFDYRVDARVFPVLPGAHRVIAEPGAAVGTLLGSCVSACIRNRETGRGGLNHFLLPGSDGSHSARYGAYAMELLVNDILSAGGLRRDLEAKVFGGAEVIGTTTRTRSVGASNARFVRDYLKGEGIAILAEDLGGKLARRVYYFPDNGQVRVQYLAQTETRQAARSEEAYRNRLSATPQTGSVELFQ